VDLLPLLPRPARRRATRAAPIHRAGNRLTCLMASIVVVLSALVSGLSAAPQALAATCGTTNVALNKTATASSLESASFPASAAVDGNTGTRWSSGFSDPQWLEVDLGSAQSICGVTLQWETAYATAFQIQVSTDNSTWTSIYSTTTGTGGTQNLTVSGSGRYIRMYGTARATQYGYSLWEFGVFAASSSTGEAPYGGTAAAVPGTVQAANYDTGGQGVAYNVTSVNGTANSYRSDGVDLEACTDTGCGDDIGWTATGQWFKYTVNVATAATYTVSLRLASPSGVTDGLHIASSSGANLSGSVNVPATGGWQTWATVTATVALPAGQQTLTINQDNGGWNIHQLTFASSGGGTTGCTGQSNQPNFGPNVYIFDPSQGNAAIQTTLDNVFNTQKVNQFGTQRYALLFKPGAYAVEANIGYYTSIQGLGLSPDAVTNNGDVTVDSFDGTGNATQNFWRSAENMEVTPSAGSDRWAVAQAGPFRRMDIQGGLELYPASDGYASGGYIADTRVTGQVSSVSQQQWYSQDSNFGSWSGGVWNMVFSGVNGAPANTFPSPPETTLATTPVSRDVPYLYIDSSGNYNVFAPSLRTNASGASWVSGSTPGTSIPMSQFFVVTPSNTAAQMNAALAEGCNLFFTPGVYNIDQTLNVTNPNTIVLGIGMPTLIPVGGIDTMHVADVDGVRLQGLLFDAGTTNSNALLTVGTAGSAVSHAANPISVQDVFFRIGGDIAGKATNSLVVNANNTLVNDIWAWRADHGNSGTVGWTVNTAQHGVVINGNNVLATGMFVEHYQNYDMQWNGQGGENIFFQNEMPYDPPNQAAWMNGSSNGYAAFEVAPNVTTFQGYGMGSYCYFNVNPAVVADHAFEAPNVSGVQFHDILTVSLGGVGVIEHVINSTGGATPSNTTPVDITSYP
jgi:F5/8 type C domain/Carbohydrate binding module (family 6)